MVESVYGIPAAAAARATPTSANGQPKPMPPVGPTAIGSFERAPRIAADVSIRATPASVFGASRTRAAAPRETGQEDSAGAAASDSALRSLLAALIRPSLRRF